MIHKNLPLTFLFGYAMVEGIAYLQTKPFILKRREVIRMKGLKITVRVEEITEVDGQEIIPIGSSFGEFVLPEALAYLGLTLREDFLSAFDWIAIDFVNENGEPVMRMRRAYKPKS